MDKVLVEIGDGLFFNSVEDARSLYEFIKSKCDNKYFKFQCHVNFDFVEQK